MELKRLRDYAFSKIPSALSGKRRCNGCSPTIAWLRRCRTFTTRNSSLNLPRLRIAHHLRLKPWRKLMAFMPIILALKKQRRSLREQWSYQRKLRPHSLYPRALAAADLEITEIGASASLI